MPRVAAILPAAGKSTRFGGRNKKPFVALDGRPVWQRAAELFSNRESVSKVYLVVAADDREEFRDRFGPYLALANVELVDGGSERFESVANALARVPATVDLIAVHDAVRPLAPASLIDAVIAAAAATGAAIPAIPVADTLKRVDPATNLVAATIDRGGLWQAQTPQVFRREWLIEAYGRRAELGESITDDAQLVEALGHAIAVVPGSASNFKITTKDDLDLAESILRSRTATGTQKPALGYGDEAQW